MLILSITLNMADNTHFNVIYSYPRTTVEGPINRPYVGHLDI